MIYLILAQFFSLFLDLFAIGRHSDHHKDPQTLLLRRQLGCGE